MPDRYPVNSIVNVQVNREIPSGLLGFVDGTRAIIHNREIAWEESSSHSRYIGHVFPAKVLGINAPYSDLELSLRLAVYDPWDQVPEKFPIGTEVKGRVVGLIDNAAFVELQEAVEGYLHVHELMPDFDRIGELLWINDHIRATVIALEPTQRRLTLSVQELLERRVQENRKDKWQSAPPANSSQVPMGALLSSAVRRQLLGINRPLIAPFSNLRRALIVEADQEFGAGLKSCLRLNGCESDWVSVIQ